MAEGKNRNLSGDYTDSQNFDAYSPENQQYLRDHSQSTVDGVPIDKLENKEDGFLGSFRKRKDSEGNTKWGIGRDDLKDAEASASKNPNASGRGGDKNASLGEKEKNVEGDNESLGGKIRNSVKGIAAAKRGDISGAIKGIKKVGPLGAILAVILGFAGVSFFGQMAMPFSLVAQFQENFDSISVSQGVRSRVFLHYQLEKNYVKDCRKAHVFSAEEFKPSARMRNKLSAHGITFEEIDGVTVMRHNGDIIVADKSQATDGRKWFDDAFENDYDFRQNYMAGARTWRGSVAAWFDTHMDPFLKKLGINRDYWKDYQRSKNKTNNGDENDMDGFRQTVADNADSDTAEGKTRGAAGNMDQGTTTDADGNPIPATSPDGREYNGFDGNNANPSGTPEESTASISRNLVTTNPDGSQNTSALKERMKGIGENLASLKNISSAFSLTTGLICGAADFVGAVSAIVAAYQAAQIIKVTAMIFESVQKTQSGESDGSPLSEVGNSLTQQAEATYTETLATNDAGDVTDQKVTTRSRSAMEANAIGALYGGTSVDMNDPSVKSFNIGDTTNKLFSTLAGNGRIRQSILSFGASIAVSAASFAACTHAKLASAAIGMAADVGEMLACAGSGIATFGAALVGCIGGKIAESTAIQAAKTALISVVVSFLTPFVASILTRKIATEVAGEDLGNAIVSGANMYMGQNHQSAGGSIASRDSLVGYYQKQDQIIAENARYERETKSPFDVSSKYTFLGSLVSQIAPLATSTSGITGTLNSASSILGNAVASLTPKSSAVSSAIKAQVESDNTEKYCPNISDIGGVADAFCNPYFITDTSTLETHPADIVNEIEDDLESDEEGNPVVKENSNLAKYIIYCGERSSQWGVADQNIMAQVSPSAESVAEDITGVDPTISNGSVSVSPLSTAIGSLPIIGDAVDMVDNELKIQNMGWITGASCVTGYEPSALENTKSWSEEKKYQRFIEDQRLAEAEGLVEQSAVSKYIAQYYEKNPLDNSFEGILARYSGLTKENVVATIDALEVLSFMSSYDPSGLYPYPAAEEDENMDIIFEEDDNNYIYAIAVSGYSLPTRRDYLIG